MPKFEKTYDEIVNECRNRKFKFPLFPEHLGENHLERHDESSDSIFYDSPRFVTHIDDYAIGKVQYQLQITKNHPLGGAPKLLIH